jgi:glycosyltransferase involved in cell wall biosynthesis
MPTVSVIIPTYNRVTLLVEALDSVFSQTRPPDETIVIDDGSTDDTEQVIRSRFGTRVRYMRQDNAGQSSARNNGIQAAIGELVAFLDSDDLWVPDRLERQLAALVAHPDLDFIFGLESKFTVSRRFEPHQIDEADYFGCLNSVECVIEDPLAVLLKENFFLPTSSVLFRKSCVATVGLMDRAVEPVEDYDYWIRFALHGFRFGFINAILCRRRLHEGNLINQKIVTKTAVVKVLARYADRSPSHRECAEHKLRGLHYDLGSVLLRNGDWSNAYAHLKAGRPVDQHGFRWRLKLAAASLFRRMPRRQAF